MNVCERVARAFPGFPAGTKIEAALSGGLDSVVLLHVLAHLKKRFDFVLHAVHVHHGLSAHADEWAAFCADYCRRLEVPLRTVRVCVEKKSAGLEAAAREARYRVFADGLSDVVALAHHQNDQVETFMLALTRGGGLRALASMPLLRGLNAQTRIWRPLLAIGRDDLVQYAWEHGLAHVEDESNRDTGLLRNWLRHAALPQWQERIPHFERQVLANIRALQQDLAVLDEVAEQDYRAVCAAGFFAVGQWRQLGSLRRLGVLRQLLYQHGISIPPRRFLEDFARVLAESDSGRWQMGAFTVCAYRGRLFVWEEGRDGCCPWSEGGAASGRLKDILLALGFVLQPCLNGLSEQALEEEGIVRNIGNNDALKLEFGHKSAKKVLQESHILPLVRKKWPVITKPDGSCMAIANLKVSEDFRAVHGFLPVYEPFAPYITELNPRQGV